MRKKKQISSAVMALLLAGSLSFSCVAEEKETNSQVATAEEMVTPEEVVEEGMTPIYGKDVADGVYTVEVASSSSMFRIADCQLTVKDGEMTAVLTMGGDGYLKLFMGTGEEAAAASEEEYIPFVENEDGQQTYEVPVEALDMGINCAAWSKRKEKWYDRVLVFKAASLPQEALPAVEKITAKSLGLEDGTYQAEVTLEGGSGRASVESPAALTVKDGEVTATVIWSSSNYDYMRIGEEKFEPVSTEGNSTFDIPVDGFDYKMPVVADTVAMSTPHEIEYTLCFDSSTLEKAE